MHCYTHFSQFALIIFQFDNIPFFFINFSITRFSFYGLFFFFSKYRLIFFRWLWFLKFFVLSSNIWVLYLDTYEIPSLDEDWHNGGSMIAKCLITGLIDLCLFTVTIQPLFRYKLAWWIFTCFHIKYKIYCF